MKKAAILFVAIFAIASWGFGKGILLLTFDDNNLESWCMATPVFAEYGAHATFFPCGNLSEDDMAMIKKLVKAGHSVGSHTVSHNKVPPQIGNFLRNWLFMFREIRPHEKAFSRHGLHIRYFAYPYNVHTAESDNILGNRFSLVRSGAESKYATVTRGSKRLDGTGIGEYYGTDIGELCDKIAYIGEMDDIMCLFSHAIGPGAKSINMKTEWLHQILETAKRFDVHVLSFEEFEKENL